MLKLSDSNPNLPHGAYGIASFHLVTPERLHSDAFLIQERDTAIRDLLEANDFKLLKFPDELYHVTLSLCDSRLVFRFDAANGEELQTLAISPSPYRKLVQDYFMMVESYESIRAEGNHFRLEAVDMARRAIHNEAAELVVARFKDKAEMDFNTARRFFTLICAVQA